IVTLTVYPLPELNIPDGLICVDENTNEVLTPYILDTGLSVNMYDFTWFFNNDMNTAIAQTSSYSATEAGQYTVTAMSWISGCTETQTINVIESSPAQSANVIPHEQFDGNYTVVVTTNGNGSYLYQIDGGALQSSNTFTDIPFGQHVVHVTDANGCSDITINIDLPEIISNDLTISPNPVTDLLTLKNDQNIRKINVLNHLGQLIVEREFNDKIAEIDLSDLNAGIYFVIIDSDKTKTVKFIKN
ncbi:MAG TPA: T9SS type A sorting domain-containing protein, partial [Flavobacterium sp.]|uniref:T9SS type A sorting domain-containing protein n=1 Tax=Flavobacterium sp. TaxID=239 RepID=UPI002CD4F743